MYPSEIKPKGTGFLAAEEQMSAGPMTFRFWSTTDAYPPAILKDSNGEGLGDQPPKSHILSQRATNLPFHTIMKVSCTQIMISSH